MDVLRFHYHLNGFEWINMLMVWAFAHQLGFFWQRPTAAARRIAWSLALAGFFALLALTSIGLHPRSMVGVAGQPFSNMGPPTRCVVELAAAYRLMPLVGIHAPESPTPAWWAQRLLWALVPAICTVPLVAAFRHFEVRAGAGRAEVAQSGTPAHAHDRISLEIARQ